MKQELTDKDFIGGNRVNAESMKCSIYSEDTKQLLQYNERNQRISDNDLCILRKDAVGRLYKKCNRCHKWKLIDKFKPSTYKSAMGGVKSICLNCESKMDKKNFSSDLSLVSKEILESPDNIKVSTNTINGITEDVCYEIINNLNLTAEGSAESNLTKEQEEIVNKIVTPIIDDFKKQFNENLLLIKCANSIATKLSKKVVGDAFLTEDQLDIVNPIIDPVINEFVNRIHDENDKALDSLIGESLESCSNEDLINELRRRGITGELTLKISL